MLIGKKKQTQYQKKRRTPSKNKGKHLIRDGPAWLRVSAQKHNLKTIKTIKKQSKTIKNNRKA